MKIFSKELDNIDSSQHNQYTHEFLKYYAWECREQVEGAIMSDEEREKLDKEFRAIFKDDFSFMGQVPYISLSNIKGIREKLLTQDDDALIAVLAPPGKGKSSLAMTFGRFIDPTFTQERVIFTNEELDEFLENATKVLHEMKIARQKGENPKNTLSGSCIVLDEGVYMIFSGDAQSRAGKKSQKLFSIIRALNLIVIVNITNFKKINTGVVDGRLAAMWKIDKKGEIQFRSKKKINKIRTKNKDIIFPAPNFRERVGYIDRECQFWRNYEVKKAEFLENAVIGEDKNEE